MSTEFLLEIGTEEIPSDYLENGLSELNLLAKSLLEKNRIVQKGDILTLGTPRRLILIIEDISLKQEDMVQEVTGPPRKAAFDQEGKPTKAAIGFAKKYDQEIEDLQFIETPKGEYLHVKREIPGRLTLDVLTETLPEMISEIPWPKSMRWGGVGYPFVRPIHWVLALLGGKVIPFKIAGLKSGNRTRGHRFMAPSEIEVEDLKDYLQKMKESSVIIDHDERVKKVESCINKAIEKVSGRALEDPELLDTVANLVEFPSAVCGNFDEGFLDLPDAVLITVMKKHQKYFAIQGTNGGLMPNFIAVNNTLARDEKIVQNGHERVLKARLSDADFFFHEDRKKPLEDRLEDLKGVIYQSELGTSYTKVERFNRLSQYIAEIIKPEEIANVELCSRLCKCDLVTEMVTEFPNLQGVMGMEYSRLDGHPEEVCKAIYEHYLPERAGAELPESAVGAIVGVADRMDTISGCFAIGLEPTGAADPFALRRHALAIIRIMDKKDWDLPLRDLIDKSLDILGDDIDFDRGQVFQKILNFFRERYKNMMLGFGYESDLIEAVISAEFNQISQLDHRIEQLKKFTEESSEFESLALTFKRVSNILKNQETVLEVDPLLFKDPCEFKLWEAYQGVKDEVYEMIEKKEYLSGLNLMVSLRKEVDDFFDGVEVLTKESPELRANRVGVLQNLARFFLQLADFSKFSI